jgi:hypothetical protein
MRTRKLADVVLQLYERSIDYGAHFNVMGWAASLDVVDAEVGLAEMSVLTNEEHEIKIALLFAAMCGVAALRVCGIAFGSEFQRTGLAAQLEILSVDCANLFDVEIDPTRNA